MRVFQEGGCMQVAMIVRDIEDFIPQAQPDLRDRAVGRLRFRRFGGEELPVLGQARDAQMHQIAIAWSGDTQLELMQPVSGYSIYDEFLDKHGEGMHHIKLYYKDVHKAARDFEARGYPVIQSGLFDEDQHYYLDTEKDFGYIIELGNAGRVPPAHRTLG